MKSITSTFAIAFLALFMSTQANAGHHTAEALEHAGMAQAHGEDGHAEVLVKHAKEAEKVHADAHKHMTEGVKHLEEAIKHGKKGHAEEAAKHIQEANVHIRQSIQP